MSKTEKLYTRLHAIEFEFLERVRPDFSEWAQGNYSAYLSWYYDHRRGWFGRGRPSNDAIAQIEELRREILRLRRKLCASQFQSAAAVFDEFFERLECMTVPTDAKKPLAKEYLGRIDAELCLRSISSVD